MHTPSALRALFALGVMTACAARSPAQPRLVTVAVPTPPTPQPPPPPPAPPASYWTAHPHSFVCQAFTRPSMYEAPKPIGEIKMSEPGDRSVSGGGFKFEVSYQNDRYEVPSISVSVASETTGKPIEQMLFQLDRLKNPSNQFGSQGFTGLHYVYDPSGAELQYICSSG